MTDQTIDTITYIINESWVTRIEDAFFLIPLLYDLYKKTQYFFSVGIQFQILTVEILIYFNFSISHTTLIHLMNIKNIKQPRQMTS